MRHVARPVLAVLVEIAFLGGLAAAALLPMVAFKPGKEMTFTRMVFVLKDGTRIEANSPQEIEEVQRLHRGQIKSGRAYPETSKGDEIRVLVSMLLGPVGLGLYAGIRNRRDLRAWLTLRARHVLLGVVGGGALLVLGLLAQVVMEALGTRPPTFPWGRLRDFSPWLVGLMVTVLAPIGEELYFRGRLLEAVRGSLGLTMAIAITSVAFAVVHGVPVLIPVYLLAGTALAVLRVWSGGLWGPIIAHALYNGIGIFFLEP